MLAPNPICQAYDLDRGAPRPVHGYWSTCLELEFNIAWLVRSFLGRYCQLPHGLLRLAGWIFQYSSFMTNVPEIAIFAIDLLLGCGNRNSVLFSVVNRIFTRLDVPFSPGCNHFEVRGQGFVGQFEAYLIVPFPRTAVSNSISALAEGNFHLPFCQNGSG